MSANGYLQLAFYVGIGNATAMHQAALRALADPTPRLPGR